MGNPNENDLLIQKVPEPELLQLAQEDTDKKISVIVELDLPPQEISFKKDQTGRGSHYPKGVVAETPAQQKKNAQVIEMASDFLESLLGTTPRLLKAARAFVVTVTPAQLRVIAQSSLTKTIRRNRSLSA